MNTYICLFFCYMVSTEALSLHAIVKSTAYDDWAGVLLDQRIYGQLVDELDDVDIDEEDDLDDDGENNEEEDGPHYSSEGSMSMNYTVNSDVEGNSTAANKTGNASQQSNKTNVTKKSNETISTPAKNASKPH